jgi:restriction system protein
VSAQLAYVKALDWFQFEKLVAVMYEQQGYSVERSGGANPDGGIDLTLTKAAATFAVQCKHWKSWRIGVKQVREFLGALADRGIQNGIFVTLQDYTSEAKQLAARHQIQLIGETELMQMLETADWKSSPSIAAIFNDTRKTCPKCESEMVQRTAKKGGNIGQRFWGCSKYPRCSYTLAIG